MKRLAIPAPQSLILTLLLCGSIWACKSSFEYALRQTTPVKADGLPTEWPVQSARYDSGTRLSWQFSNDRQNLYFCIRASDETAQMKLLRSGLSLWIDTRGGRSKETGITLPLPGPQAPLSSADMPMNPGQRPDPAEMRRRFLERPLMIKITGFIPSVPEIIAADNTFGISAAINWDNGGVLICEGAIPFDKFKPDFGAADTVKAWSIGLELAALPMPSMPQGMGG
ncbi:MAG: hypothetical protein EAZ89_21325, partial [Bacteroidetes bacterium]